MSKHADRLYDDCEGCGQQYELDRESGRAWIFPYEVIFTHVAAKCPHCGVQTTIFIDKEMLRIALKRMPLAVALDVPPALRRLYVQALQAEGVPEEPTKELSPRHEQLLLQWSQTWASLPDETLAAEMELPAPPHNLPEKWSE